jgi:hypothetical protein
MAIAFQTAPGGQSGGPVDLLTQYFIFMEKLGIPREAFLTFVLVLIFLLAAFFFRTNSFGSGRR